VRGRRQIKSNAITPLTGITASSLGCLPGSGITDAQKRNNYEYLMAAAAAGNIIQIDGDYTLYWTALASMEATRIIFVGTDPSLHKIRVVNKVTWFDIIGTESAPGLVHLEKIGIHGEGVSASILITAHTDAVFSFTQNDCYITGTIRILSATAISDTLNVTTNPTYIKKFIVENNTFSDVNDITGSRSVFYLQNLQIQSGYIRNNTVKNFSYSFLWLFCKSFIQLQHRALGRWSTVYIEDNIVYCADGYDAQTIHGGYNAQYYFFAGSDDFRIVCKRNVFGGWHVHHTVDTSTTLCTSVYDNYFSVNQLVYEDNTVKNIVNFTTLAEGLQNYNFPKGKNRTTDATVDSFREYRRNAFIVEASYADRFGEDRYLLRKSWNIYSADFNWIVAEHNFFDGYIYNFDDSDWVLEEYTFHGNTVIMQTMDQSTFEYETFDPFVPDEPRLRSLVPIKDNHTGRVINFTDNIIISKSAAFGGAIGAGAHYFVTSTVSGADTSVITVTGNTIKMYGLTYANEAAEKAKYGGGGTIDVSGNTITVLT
jgi:hypothetical protein